MPTGITATMAMHTATSNGTSRRFSAVRSAINRVPQTTAMYGTRKRP